MASLLTNLTITLTSIGVLLPYTVAFLVEMLYGSTSRKGFNYQNFVPRRVYALNYALMMDFKKLKYIRLWYQWNKFYKNASKNTLEKDIDYGRHSNKLDIYKPCIDDITDIPPEYKSLLLQYQLDDKTKLKPVILFLYGGTWGSGDKNMYGLLCTNLANYFNCYVVCPNYSIYPKGFVDDMVQDAGDALEWIKVNASSYSADGNKIILIGHSAGAHLALLTTFELCLKRLASDPQNMFNSEEEISFDLEQRKNGNNPNFEIPYLYRSDMNFFESNYNGISSSSHSFPPSYELIKEEEADEGKQRDNSRLRGVDSKNETVASRRDSELLLLLASEEDSQSTETLVSKVDPGAWREYPGLFTDLNKGSKIEGEGEINHGGVLSSYDVSNGTSSTYVVSNENFDDNNSESFYIVDRATSQVAEREKSGNDNVIDCGEIGSKIESQIVQLDQTFSENGNERNKPILTEDVFHSIKLVIGLAGVYDIEEHYKYETMRGIEHMSTMGKAMYDLSQFKNFSPSLIVADFPLGVRLPIIKLFHGTNDTTVPYRSSMVLGEQLWNKGVKNCNAYFIMGCDHRDICLDLMNWQRRWFQPLMVKISESINDLKSK